MTLPPSSHKKKLIVALSVILIIGFLTTSLVSYFVSRASLRGQIDEMALPLTSDNIYSEIQRDLIKPVLISSFMAHDTFLIDWILGGEKNVAQITQYLKEVKTQYNTFTSFFVSEKTKIYYQAEGILKKVSPDSLRDEWYFRVRQMDEGYELNIDPDMANQDTITIFINFKVSGYDGNFLGAAGVGLDIYSVIELMEKYSKKYDRNIYFTDWEGNIMLKNESFPSGITNIKDAPCYSDLSENILDETQITAKYRCGNHVVHLNKRFVPELNWHLFVEQSEQDAISGINSALVLNLIICAIITAIVVFLTAVSISLYQKITRRQQDEIFDKNQELEQKNTQLEAAIKEKANALEQNTLLMREMNHRVKNNLAIIQSLLSLQSNRDIDDASRMALQESEGRIRAVAHLHQLLSRHMDLSKMPVRSYVNDLVRDIIAAFDIDTEIIEVKLDVVDIDLDMNLVIPLVLILNELVTNAFKYAFDRIHKGVLLISLQEHKNNELELIVQDNGKGLSADFVIGETDSMGTMIISLLVEQIHGKLSFTSAPNKGTTFRIILPMKQE